jgi:hypothetical protein
MQGGEWLDVSCPGCGEFGISKTAEKRLESQGSRRGVVTHFIRLACDRGELPEISLKLMERILATQSIPSVAEQADDFHRWLGDELLKLGRPDEWIPISNQRRLAALVGAYPEPSGEALMYLISHLAAEGYIEPATVHHYGTRIGLTFKGWRRYEELKAAEAESNLAFMAMPFNVPLLDRIFAECFKPAVAKAGFELRRIIDRPQAGLIDDRLRVEIRKSRFLVCELTRANAGAYWEAGFAEGLGRPVIYTCEKQFFSEKGTHFDTNHCHTVLWLEAELAKAGDDLEATVRETLIN